MRMHVLLTIPFSVLKNESLLSISDPLEANYQHTQGYLQLLPMMALNPCVSNRPIHGFYDFFWPSHHHRLNIPENDGKMIMPVIPNLTRNQGMILHSSSPGYEIHEADGHYSISVYVPSVNAADITVQVEDDGKLLHIYGGRNVDDGTKRQIMKFSKSFTIGSHMDIDKMSANLSDGVLTVAAPVKDETVAPVRTIVVTASN